MKNLKKIASLLLVLVMVFALSATAMAAPVTVEPGNTLGSITVNNEEEPHIYSAYQLLKLVEYSKDDPSTDAVEPEYYLYQLADGPSGPWAQFVKSEAILGKYLNIDDDGFVTWVAGANREQFAVEAMTWLINWNADTSKENIPAAATTTTTGSENKYTGTMSGLNLGYYLVTSTMGTIVNLTTTATEVSINDKNNPPAMDKKVKEDSNPDVWGETNDADIGQIVEFQSVINVRDGATGYKYVDMMSAGLTYNGGAKVYVKQDANAEEVLHNELMDINGEQVSVYDHITNSQGMDATFQIIFGKKWLTTLPEGAQIIIRYSATVNKNAVIGKEGNPNQAKLQYGQGSTLETEWDYTKTYVWGFNVHKYDAATNKALAGVQFILYKDASNYGIFTPVQGDVQAAATEVELWKFTGWTANKEEATKLTTCDHGDIIIQGLDSDTYYLEETKAPSGYIPLTEAIPVFVSSQSAADYIQGEVVTVPLDYQVAINNPEFNAELGESEENPKLLVLSNKTVQVENKPGTALPSTGGIGTTIFYILGGILVVGAAVLLITKKRVGAK